MWLAQGALTEFAVDEISLDFLLLALLVLLLLSAFFSSAETSMMAVNRYRLRHAAQSGRRGARLAEALLMRTDHLLAVILLGNNLVNAAAAALVTVIAFRVLGENELALTLATLLVTFLILVFSEVTPKVLAAAYPERLAPVVSYPLTLLSRLFQPLVWFINLFVRGMIRLLRIRLPDAGSINRMGVEELRTMLVESGLFLRKTHRTILQNLFELEKISVEDVMRSRGEIEAIDLNQDDDEIVRQLETSHHAWVVIYAGELNEVRGIASVRHSLARLREEAFEQAAFDRAAFMASLRDAYFIPEGTSVLSQLAQFQHTRQRLGLVVDEYGELIGLVTLADIVAEIVGEFDLDGPLESPDWVAREDGSYLVEGSANLRELNRKLDLHLPLTGPRTLNGLILEQLEAMPEPDVTVLIAGYPVELLQVQERRVKTARIYPRQSGAGEDDARD